MNGKLNFVVKKYFLRNVIHKRLLKSKRFLNRNNIFKHYIEQNTVGFFKQQERIIL
jgi:hypothetical protein